MSSSGLSSLCQKPPSARTLVFAITALYLLMYSLLYLPFKDPCSRGLVKSSRLQDMCGIDPIIGSPSHHTLAIDLEFKYRGLNSIRI